MARYMWVWVIIGLLGVFGTIAAQDTPEESIPDPAPLIERPDDDLKIVLLFGTATRNPNNPGLADSVMLAAVNRTAGSVSLLALPRDLYVYVPDFGMKKLNTAYYYGEVRDGTGVQVLKDTIRYNLGVEVDYYAHVNFAGFFEIVDTIGGIDLAVDCTIYDWKLKSWELDMMIAENYEMFLMPVGVHHMDANTALWYVRSRNTSSDIDRGRRQQDVLRAIWRTIRSRGLLTDLPALWSQVTEHVDTDFTLTDALGYLPFASQFEADRMVSYRFKLGQEIRNAFSPAPERAAILAIEPDPTAALITQFLTPPTENQVARNQLRVEIVNTSGVEQLEYVAADRLAQEGFTPVIVQENSHFRNYTAIYDYTGQTKGGPVAQLQRVLRVTDDGVMTEPDATRAADYKIYLGHMYLYWSCTRDVIQPRIKIDEHGTIVIDESALTPTPTP